MAAPRLLGCLFGASGVRARQQLPLYYGNIPEAAPDRLQRDRLRGAASGGSAHLQGHEAGEPQLPIAGRSVGTNLSHQAQLQGFARQRARSVLHSGRLNHRHRLCLHGDARHRQHASELGDDPPNVQAHEG